jgi:membrane protein DedA with SNARE-associated domain
VSDGQPDRPDTESPVEPEAQSPVEPGAAERPWWDDPSLPWRHQPTRADIACFTWLGVVAVYGIVINILRPGLLGSLPHVLASLGSWSGTVLVGAMANNGDPWWPLVWLLGTLGLIKFDWVYWWAGRLWGRELIDVWSARSERTRRINERAAQFARKYETLALALSMVPGVPGRGVIVLVLGEAGTSLAKFLTVSLVSSAVVVGACLGAGYWIGEPAVALMQTYGSYLWYVSLAILVLVVVQAWLRQRQRPSAS